MEGFLHSMLGMKKITHSTDEERSNTHYRVKEMNQERKAKNRWNKSNVMHNRRNIFEDNGYFYQKCSELQAKVKKLERANKYLIQQVIDTMSVRNIVDSRKNSSNNFQLETGISLDSGSGDSSSKNNKNIKSQKKTSLGKNISNTIIISGREETEESITNSKEFVQETFKLFREMLSNTLPLKNMSDRIFGVNFNFGSALESDSQLAVISKILRASINSFLILDKYTQSRESRLASKNAHQNKFENLDFDKRLFSGKSACKSPTLINLDSVSVKKITKKSKIKPIKTFKSKYVMENKPEIAQNTHNLVYENPRSFKNLLISPYRNSSPSNSHKSPQSIKSKNSGTPITIDLTKIDFPKVKHTKNSNISSNSKQSERLFSDSFLNISNVRTNLIEPLFGQQFQNFQIKEETPEKKLIKEMCDAAVQTESFIMCNSMDDSSKFTAGSGRVGRGDTQNSNSTDQKGDKSSFMILGD